MTHSQLIFCWLYGKRLGIKELAGCIGLQNLAFHSEVGSALTWWEILSACAYGILY
jgi:hypothetical protein